MRETKAKERIKPDYLALKNEVYKNYRQGALRRGHAFDISKEDFFLLMTRKCTYCGQEPSMSFKGTKRKIMDISQFLYNGVDRVDNGRGYEKDNCVSCCKICNNSKKDLSVTAWFDWIRRISKYKKL